MHYEILKTIHIVAACAMVGTTLGNGVLHGLARGATHAGRAAQLLRGVMAINFRIMGPAFGALVVTGGLLARDLGVGITEAWLLWGIVLTAVLVALFAVGLLLENAMHRCAKSVPETAPLPDKYQTLFRRAIPIGGGATILSLVVIFIMVAKP